MSDLQTLRALRQNLDEWKQELGTIKESVSQTASQGLESFTQNLNDSVLPKLKKTTDDLSEATKEITDKLNEVTKEIRNAKKELLQTIMTEVRFDMNLQKQIYKNEQKARIYKALSQVLEYMNKKPALIIIVVAVVFLAAGYILCKLIS